MRRVTPIFLVALTLAFHSYITGAYVVKRQAPNFWGGGGVPQFGTNGLQDNSFGLGNFQGNQFGVNGVQDNPGGRNLNPAARNPPAWGAGAWENARNPPAWGPDAWENDSPSPFNPFTALWW